MVGYVICPEADHVLAAVLVSVTFLAVVPPNVRPLPDVAIVTPDPATNVAVLPGVVMNDIIVPTIMFVVLSGATVRLHVADTRIALIGIWC